MTIRRPLRPRCRGDAAVACLVLLGWLGSCTAPGPTGAGTAPATDLPPGAVPLGRDLYQVPIGADADGCQMYRLYSPTLMVAEVISYRSRDGGFTIDRRAAVCNQRSSTNHAPSAQP